MDFLLIMYRDRIIEACAMPTNAPGKKTKIEALPWHNNQKSREQFS
jgi:hypothetical protein